MDFHVPMRRTTQRLRALTRSVSALASINELRTFNSPLEGLNQSMCVALNLEYLYCFVRRASRQSPAIVVQAGIVLETEDALVARGHRVAHR